MDRHAATCPCTCHGRPNHPCDWDGGCGHLHTEPTRPATACLTCPPPHTQAWRLADKGYRTCTNCYDRLRDILKEIDERYLLLDTRPGANSDHGGRGAPGFGSRPPASDHIITMRDPRSKSCEVIDEWFEPIQLPGNSFGFDRRTNPRLANIDKPHREQDTPPLSVAASLASWAGLVAEERNITPPPGLDVHELCKWLDKHIAYITAQDWIADFAADMRKLLAQLKPVTGEPGRRSIGNCPNVLDTGEHTKECGARLYAPLKGDSIVCNTCRREWPRSEWLRLGDLLQDAS